MSTNTPATATPAATRLPLLQTAAEGAAGAYLDLLADLVAIDSGSLDVAGVQRITEVLVALLHGEGFAVDRHPIGEVDVLHARRPGEGPRVLLCAHADTVFDVGTAARHPFTVRSGRAHGPGVADDKCGLASALVVARLLAEVGSTADLTILITPDEELGSPRSAAVTARLARQADVALCLEAAREDGSLVSARKGGANLVATYTGRAAHAGVEPHKGVNAALQMAHVIVALQALNDPDVGTTVNVGRAEAGTRSNIVADTATLWIDARARTVDAFEALMADVDAAVRTVHVEGIEVEVAVRAQAPPMEATDATLAVADHALDVGRALGLDLRHVATGGLGDANVIATAGIPVLDGLAPVGGDDHTHDEWLDVTSVGVRLALLAGLVDRLAEAGVPGSPPA